MHDRGGGLLETLLHEESNHSCRVCLARHEGFVRCQKKKDDVTCQVLSYYGYVAQNAPGGRA